jgi:hypothetical protein
MAHDEAPVKKFRVSEIQLWPQQTGHTASAATSGSLIFSGAKLWIDTGAACQVVTSA